MARRRDTESGQLRTSFLDSELIEIVRAIVLSVDSDWPQDVTPTQYNRARQASDWRDSPSTQGLVRRWHMTWDQILHMLFSGEIDPVVSIRQRGRKTQRPERNLEDAVYALRLVALRLGVETLTAAQYDAEIEAIGREGGTATMHGAGETERLLRSADIEDAFRDGERSGWDVALEASGLAQAVPGSSLKILSPEEGVQAFLTEVGCLPWTAPALRDYTRAKGLRIATVRNFPGAVSAAQVSWRAMGRWTPEKAPAIGQRPEISVERVSTAEGGYKRWDKNSTTEEVIEGIVAALREAHRLGVELTQTRHRALAGQHHEIPQPSFVQRHAEKYAEPKTTAAALRKEAAKRFQRELNADRARDAPA